MKDESTVSQEVVIKARYMDCSLMRNNSGACIDQEGRLVRYGLDNTSKVRNDKIKSSDYIGITKVVVTQEMVGKTLGVFTAVEMKREDWKHEKKKDKKETAQEAFINWVKSLGGYAGFANCAEDLLRIIKP